MSDSFITYKEDLKYFNPEAQDQILKGCLFSWELKKFKTKVLTRADAVQHSLYASLYAATKKHCKIKKTTPEHIIKKRQYHSEASILRWLAFASTKENNFFLGDYDIFNMQVTVGELSYKNLTFLDGACLCFSFLESWQWAEHFAEMLIKNIDIMEEWDASHVFYHDQDLVENLLKAKPQIFSENSIFFEKGLIKQPMRGVIPNDCKFLHISHFAHRDIGADFGCVELARLSTVNNCLRLI
jgi:hypothetical protein